MSKQTSVRYKRGNEMKFKFIIATAATLAIIAIVFVSLRKTPTADPISMPALENTVVAEDVQQINGPEARAPLHLQGVKGRGFIDPKVLCGDNYNCLIASTTASSEKDYQWMLTHGYPTQEESDRLAKLSEAELEAEATNGSLTAMTALGARMIERGDKKGLSWYLRAADRGSIYAYHANSKAAMSITGFGSGLVESAAYLRVAYMLGDYKAVDALYQFAEAKGLGIVEFRAIDLRAASLYQTYAKNRRPAPRPQ